MKKEEDRNRDNAPKEKKKKTQEEKDKPKLSYLERKEFNQLEQDIEKLEAQKAEITAQFNDSSLPSEEIQNLSIELGRINQLIDEKEMRWLELSEYA